MDLIQRNEDVISKKGDLELLYSINNFPIFQHCVDTSFDEDLLADMNYFISKETGVIQLNPLIPLEILYNRKFNAVGNLWKEHHKSFASFLSKYKFLSLLEIGGSTGSLAFEFMQNNPNIDWTILEPNPNIEKNTNIKIIKKIFDKDINFDCHYDTIVHSHTLEHSYDPFDFLKNVNNNLKTNFFHFFSVPRMQVWFENFYTSFLDFEHNIYLTENIIDYLLEKSGFAIIEKQFYGPDHSIFYATKKITNSNLNCFLTNNYNLHKKLFFDYFSKYKLAIEKINNKINTSSKKKYLFGGHFNSQFLIYLGLNVDNIISIIDNDIKKHKKRLYGTNLFADSPEILSQINDPLVIIWNAPYTNEIIKSILDINPKTEIIKLF